MVSVTIENYEEKRRALAELNSNRSAIILHEPEKRVDVLLSELKAECSASKGGKLRYDIPVLTDQTLRESRLYDFCSRLPKGAELHVHHMALLPAHELIGLLRETPEFCIHADHSGCELQYVPLSESLPEGYMRFAEALDSGFYSREELIRCWTVLGVGDEEVWSYFEKLFSRHSALSKNLNFIEKYYDYAFRYYCRHGILHIEVHMMLRGEMDEGVETVKAVRRAYYRVKKDYPDFTFRIIGAGVKADNEKLEKSRKCFLNASYAQELVKDESVDGSPELIIGFDLVNEEDGNRTLHDFAPLLLRVKQQYPNMKLFLHGGESLSAENENLIDAYLLGVKRVGHGFNLYRYPDLHTRYIQSEICLEVCPISNRALGYARDLRNHPATEYLRTGLPLALCSDDPSYLEYESLTDDFFAAVLAWNLSLADLKQLGINSILYSGLDNESKYRALRAYRVMWQSFIGEILAKLET